MDNNLIICVDNGMRIRVLLKLRAETKKRLLGVVVKSTRTIRMVRKRNEHLFHQSYGFCHLLLETAKTFDTVRLCDEFGEWKIPREKMLEMGRFLHFQKSGFEKQIFITLEQLDQYKTPPVI